MQISPSHAGGRIRRAARRPSSAVALDIGPDAIVVLQLAGGERGRVRHAIVHPLPAGVVADGEVVDADALTAELRALFSEHRLGRDVRVGLAHPRLMVRMVELPASLHGSDLDSAVRHLADDLLPVGLDHLIVDYRRLAHGRGDAGDQQRILMAAARVDGIERLAGALGGAGLRVSRIGVSGLAMLRALDRPPVGDDAVLYVQAGALTNVVIAERGEPLLVRAASAGSESIAAALAERAGITHAAARERLAAVGVGRDGRQAPSDGGDVDGVAVLQAREGLRRVIAEIQSSSGFYTARPDARPIGAVVVTGEMAAWPGVLEALGEELHLPVLAAARDGWPQGADDSIAPHRLDVAMGLSLAGEAERPDLRPARAGRERAGGASTRVAQVACGAVALLAAAVVYLVVVANQVASGREELADLSGAVVQAERQAAALKPYDDFARAAVARRDAVATVAGTRFNWDRTLRQLAKVAPDGVWLTSAKGTLTPTTQVDGDAPDGDTATLRGALPAPALELAGCATSDGSVPAYMDRLHGMTGVTKVGFSRSERVGKDGAAGGACGDGARGARFSLVAYFKPSPSQVAAQAAAPAAAGQPAATTPTTGGTP